MSTFVMPVRRWKNDPAPEQPQPVVLVSSREDAPVPRVAGAARLAAAAEAAGWTVRLTYALAEVPATSRRATHRLASVAVRLARGPVRGWACWHQVDDGNWRFDTSCLGFRRLGARELTAALFEVTT